jgi:hypothetical protein
MLKLPACARAARPRAARSQKACSRTLLATFTLIFTIPFVSIASCAYTENPIQGTERLTVTLPAPHPAWSLASPGRAPSYRLRWYDSEGNAREIDGISDDTEIEVEAGIFTPIILECESDRAGIPGSSLQNAGALYPLHARRESGRSSIDADWLRGIDATCAELACRRANGGFETGRLIASHFNWLKFDAEILKKQKPFLVDARWAADAILSGKVSVYDVKERKLFDVAVPHSAIPSPIPKPERFIPAWQADQGSLAPEDDSFTTGESPVITARCPAGISFWFGKDGMLTINAENMKKPCVIFTRYVLRD